MCFENNKHFFMSFIFFLANICGMSAYNVIKDLNVTSIWVLLFTCRFNTTETTNSPFRQAVFLEISSELCASSLISLIYTILDPSLILVLRKTTKDYKQRLVSHCSLSFISSALIGQSNYSSVLDEFFVI